MSVECDNQKFRSIECTSSLVCDKSPSKVSNTLENSSSTQKSKSNECTLSLDNNLKKFASPQKSKSNDYPVSIECVKSSSKVLESKELPQHTCKTCDKSSSKVFKSKELPQKISKTITIDDVGVENSKPNEYTLSVDGKSHSKLSYNLKTSSSTHKSKSNERTLSLGKNSK